MRPFLLDLQAGGRPDFPALVEALGDVLPLLADLARTPQDPEWHGEGDVATHTHLVLAEAYDLAEGLRPEDRLVFVLAAALHDLGKALTTRRAEADTGQRRTISPGTPTGGAPIWRTASRSWGCLTRWFTPSWRSSDTIMISDAP